MKVLPACQHILIKKRKLFILLHANVAFCSLDALGRDQLIVSCANPGPREDKIQFNASLQTLLLLLLFFSVPADHMIS